MNDEYDYIIVGAGSAGCPLANRLSEDPACRVLLIEAGPKDRNPWVHIPIGYYRTMTSALSWGYQTAPDPGIAGRSILWPRGRVLGGSSSINGLVYTRGQPADFDLWRSQGNPGWGFDDVLPYFRRSEDQERGGDDYHGKGGPLKVSDIRDKREICDAFIEAAQQIGIPANDDFNAAQQEGVGYFQTTSYRGRRCSAAVAYLKPVRRRRNLRIETGALATQLLFSDRRVAGLAYRQQGQQKTVTVTREIILAGGAINSPQLLQLSGIGPAAALQGAGVDVLLDLPGVGRSLQDHYQTRVVVELNRPISVNSEVGNPLRLARVVLQYLAARRGPLTFSAGQVGVFTRVLPESATPDVQVHFIPFSATGLGGRLHDYPGVTVSVCILRPESRGEVMIRNADPLQHPRIQPNYLSTDHDRRVMVEGLKMVRQVTAAPAFRDHVRIEREPGDHCVGDDDLLAYVRENGNTIFHPTSTCRMGQDAGAVVDERLRVRGLSGLRVADCSVMPTVVSANTNAAAVMIGEKCADMVLQDARAAPH